MKELRWKRKYEFCMKRKVTVTFIMTGYTGTTTIEVVISILFANFSNKYRTLKRQVQIQYQIG